MNAKVGADNSVSDRVMGRHESGIINENRERLVGFCTTNNLVIGGTLFPHQEIHIITWCSPNGRDRNQIDHLMINGKWRSSLRDVKVRRGANIGSDHHLVTACLKLKLKGAGRQQRGAAVSMSLNLNIRMCENLLFPKCATDLRLLWN